MTQNQLPDGTYGPTPLFKRKVMPLDPVPVTPLPEHSFFYPFKSVEEYVAALEQENKRLVTELENEQLRKGQMPIGKVWWQFASAGVGAAIMAIFAMGC